MSGGTKDVDDYKYMQVVDALRSINQEVNLIGIVIDSTPPKRSKGTDSFCSVKIIGESRPKLGIFVRFFGETNEKLPIVESVGDVILVTRVKMKTQGSEVYAMFNKKRSSFALYEGMDYYGGKEFVPYKKSPNFPDREQDKKLITGLRKWLIHNQIEGLNDFLLLREIKEDTPPASIESKLEDEIENPLPLYLEPSLLSRDILCTFPPVGTVLRMMANQGIKKIGVNSLHTNRWVKFVNIKCEVLAGLWRAVLLPSSKLCFLSDDDARITKRQRPYDKRVSTIWGRMPFTSFPGPSHITGGVRIEIGYLYIWNFHDTIYFVLMFKYSETGHPNVPFVTLMNVLAHREVMCKFKCVVRVVAIFPWRAEEFLSPSGIYRVRLTLEDPTARIHAFLYAEDGINFFGNDLSANTLTRKRNMLLGIAEGDNEQSLKTISRNPPWIGCCLKSYYIDKSDTWGSRNFRIFGTAFVG